MVIWFILIMLFCGWVATRIPNFGQKLFWALVLWICVCLAWEKGYIDLSFSPESQQAVHWVKK